MKLKAHVREHKPMAKLVAFKLVVALNFIQTVRHVVAGIMHCADSQIIFLILDGTGALNPTASLTYADLHVGIPRMLPCIEMVFISVLLAWAYSAKPYLTQNRRGVEDARAPKSYQGGFLGIRAFLAAMNPMETIQGILFAVRLILDGEGRGRRG